MLRTNALETFNNQTVSTFGAAMAPFFYTKQINRNPTMTLSIAGGPVVGFTQNESLLELITRRLRTGWRSFVDTLNQRGNPQ